MVPFLHVIFHPGGLIDVLAPGGEADGVTKPQSGSPPPVVFVGQRGREMRGNKGLRRSRPPTRGKEAGAEANYPLLGDTGHNVKDRFEGLVLPPHLPLCLRILTVRSYGK